jgi:hypothetical protein
VTSVVSGFFAAFFIEFNDSSFSEGEYDPPMAATVATVAVRGVSSSGGASGWSREGA